MFQWTIQTRLKNECGHFGCILTRHVRHEHHAARFALGIIKIDTRREHLIDEANIKPAPDILLASQPLLYF